jgi:hypothetical protein
MHKNIRWLRLKCLMQGKVLLSRQSFQIEGAGLQSGHPMCSSHEESQLDGEMISLSLRPIVVAPRNVMIPRSLLLTLKRSKESEELGKQSKQIQI